MIREIVNGDCAKMHEALERLRQRFDNNVMAYQDRYFKFSGWHWHKKAAEAERWRDVFLELREACDAALAAPPRNCDVGTAEEQCIRHAKWCESRAEVCLVPKADKCRACFAKWAQMPYVAKKGGVK